MKREMTFIRKILCVVTVVFTMQLSAQSFYFDFNTGYDGWTGDFADYPVGDSVWYDLRFFRTQLPLPLDTSIYALKITGINYSDDLFMFIKRKITGLQPNTTYALFIDVEFASNAPTNAFGVGGPPGEAVTMKAGATLIEPQKVDVSGYYLMNIDKCNQVGPGTDMDTIGHVGVSDTTTVFRLINRNNAARLFIITTDSSGEVWVCIGSDSGFEARTTLYYNSITLEFNKVTGINKIGSSEKVFIYPNPAQNYVNVITASNINQIEVYNTQGQLLLKENNTNKINIESLSPAIYYLRVVCNDKIHVEKIILN